MSHSGLKPCETYGGLCDNPEHWAEPQEFPFTKPEGSDVEMFIQWKGTDVCLDFHCPCGTHSHLDTDFTYYVECPTCGAVYEMGTQVIAKQVDPAKAQGHAKMGEVS